MSKPMDVPCPKCEKDILIQLRDIRADDKTPMTCGHCGEDFLLDGRELRGMFDNLKKEVESIKGPVTFTMKL